MVNTKENNSLRPYGAWGGLASLLGEHRKRSFRLAKHIFTDYFAKQYERKPAICIGSPLDKEIYPCPEAVKIYFSFISFLLGSLGYVKQEFGAAIKDDVDKFLDNLTDLYKNTGFIFENAPTTFRGRKSKGLCLRILHLLDRPRNYFPSIHVVLVGYAYFQVCRIIDKHSDGKNYLNARCDLFDRMVSIIEACLMTKQHGIRDIAGGLAIISLKDSGFDVKMAEKIIYAMFDKNLFGMTEETIRSIRISIFGTYRDIIGSVGCAGVGDSCAYPLVDYVRSI